MATLSHEGPTPNGGVRSTLTYLDADGKECEKADATQWVGEEFDADGKSIMRTYGRIAKSEPLATF